MMVVCREERNPRTRNPPKHHSDYVVCKKTSIFCPKCREAVEKKDGAECQICKALWHYTCAGTSSLERHDGDGDAPFLCPQHQCTSMSNEIPSSTLVKTIQIAPFKMNYTQNIRKQLKKIDNEYKIELKDSGKQFLINLGATTYQFLLHNMITVGHTLGIDIKKDDVDLEGGKLDTHFTASPSLHNIDIPMALIFYHTTNNILIQLKGRKTDGNWNQKVECIHYFVKKVLEPVIHSIECSRGFRETKEALRTWLQAKLNDTGMGDTFELNQFTCSKDLICSLNVEESSQKQPCEPSSAAEEAAKDVHITSEEVEDSACTEILVDENLKEEVETITLVITEERLTTPTKQQPSTLEESYVIVEPVAEPANNMLNKSTPSSNEKITPRKSRSPSNKAANMLATSESARITLKQKVDTLETHHETLRRTIFSKDETLQSQTKVIENLRNKVAAQEKTLKEQKILIDLHESIALAYMEMIVNGEDQSENIELPPDNNLHCQLKEMLRVTSQLRDDLKKSKVEVDSQKEKAEENNNKYINEAQKREQAEANLKQNQERINKKTKENSALINQVAFLEDSVVQIRQDSQAISVKAEEDGQQIAALKSKIGLLEDEREILSKQISEISAVGAKDAISK